MTSSTAPRVRLQVPDRQQPVPTPSSFDALVPPEHPARILWTLLGTLDLSHFEDGITSLEGQAGRALLSPRMMLTLWLFALTDGVSSARRIALLTARDAAYRWIVADVHVSHDALSAFRRAHGDALDGLFTDVLATLLHKGLLSLALLGQDGTRTRAAATAPSFRTYGSLLECRAQAALHLKAVRAAADEHSVAEQARRETMARDFQARVEAAITAVQALQAERGPADAPARASTTDAEARVMKMGDGGFRPAFNVQYAVAGSAAGGPRAVVGVIVTNVGSDMGSLTPMIDQIVRRTGQCPAVVLADCGHAKHEDIIAATQRGATVLVPPSEQARPIAVLREEGAPPEVIAWRERMETAEATEQYRARASLCELNNAHQKTHQGIGQFLVRGLHKVTCVILMGAIATNLMQFASGLLA
jgi:transposase